MTNETRTRLSILEIFFLILLSAAALLAAGGAAWYLQTHRVSPPRRHPAQVATAVETKRLHPVSHRIHISTMGTVIPAVEVQLQAQVSGEITAIHPEFLEGGLISAGETLITIDPEDYELALISSEAQLENARYDLKVEQGYQDVAKREWELLDMAEQASDLDAELALRQPHLKTKQAQIKAAEAQLKKAKLNLSRTKVSSPVNVIVRAANVDVGDLAAQQTVLATLVGTDAYWVQATVPVDQISSFLNPNKDAVVSASVFTQEGGESYSAQVIKLLSDLEPNGRMARVLVEIQDPLGLSAQKNPAKRPLLLGEFVRVIIEGHELNDVFLIPRSALRDGDRLWLASSENTLEIINPEIVWRDETQIIVKGLKEGARLICSELGAPVVGMALDPEDRAPSDQEAPQERGPQS